MTGRMFEDRRDAGRALARALQRCTLSDPVILGLPRGGVPVAYEIALALNSPLDTMIVRKLGSMICLQTPTPFVAVGHFYRQFAQTEDDEVRRLLDACRAKEACNDGRSRC